MRGIRQIAPSSATRRVLVPLNSTLNSNLSTVLLTGLLTADGVALTTVRPKSSRLTIVRPSLAMPLFDFITILVSRLSKKITRGLCCHISILALQGNTQLFNDELVLTYCLLVPRNSPAPVV